MKSHKTSFLPKDFIVEATRRQGNRPKRRNILIVCEGEKTEPGYFESFRRQLVGGQGDRVFVVGMGDNTLSLVEKAKELVEERAQSDAPPFYYVWIVFDKDDFPDERFDNAINAIEKEDLKFKSGIHPHWKAAWSNEAFELWYLLHFQEMLGGPIARGDLYKMLSNYFKNELGISDGYHKNAPNIFNLLRERMPLAINRGERASLACKDRLPHACNPATRVFELVKQLLAYM